MKSVDVEEAPYMYSDRYNLGRAHDSHQMKDNSSHLIPLWNVLFNSYSILSRILPSSL